jgi:transposase
MIDTRQVKGLEIAATARITPQGDTWIVPSQHAGRKYGGKSYTVRLEPFPNCTCPDYQDRQQKCKHIYAVERFIQPEPIVEIPEPVKKPTYKQEWPAYNLAQTNEKARFQELLYTLCNGIEEPEQKMGRPRLSLADMIFSIVLKVYCGFSTRRTISDLREAQESGYLERAPHFNSLSNYMEAGWLTNYLYVLITESSLPLKAVESNFAVDSSGFSTCRYARWFDEKYGKTQVRERQEWVKLHLMCGVTTNVVTSCVVTDRYAGDSPQFKGLVNTTAQNFVMDEISADKAYSSRPNLKLVVGFAARPFIDFKEGTNPERGKDTLWKRMYHFYAYNQEWFYKHYHKRSNVETTFSMIKAKFGGSLRSKTYQAQVNEALCKVLCHNICCLIHSIYELGIEPTFWND